ncbi:sigma-54-dependent Fis family transcriptional regulator [Petrotoga sp. 9PWA.NaAc.5.4]|uniref:sigma-54 interaction domain-containing protein n=1 Tax=Petrotoga sp. 9PWA.NaAc.5.4 TaxID=1434328 RepID=UPI000CC6A16D|nr:sigma 54-interacting transcriptional regulator [Petrotoga sp. 9PWA.NaAc.5.4]PNR92823.1 ATPase AAA [Petrotoga sp. 9PWA.NaAc.5.4]
MTEIEMMRSLLDQLQEGIIIIDEREIIFYINETACRIFEVEKDDILGKTAIESIPNTRLHIVLRTGEAEYDKLQNLGNKVILTSRIPIKNSNNETIAVAAVFRDVTTLQRLAEEITNLREIEALLTSIIDSTSDAISVADQEGRVVMVNRAYTRITGLAPREVIGKPATIDLAEGESLHIRCAREKKPIYNVRKILATNKKEIIASVTPLFVNNEFKGSVAVIHDISEIQRLINELEATKRLLKKESAAHTFDDIVSKSPTMKEVITEATKIADVDVNLLLVGEFGVGKEVLAQAIHNASNRREGPYLKLNFSLISFENQEEFLFGKNSYIANAHKGTLFLENIHLMNTEIQQKFLKLLNENIFECEYYDFVPDVRFIFATTEDLKILTSLGKFSKELLYKISVVTIEVPPLRERKEDIPDLAKQLLHTLNQKYGRIVYGFTDDAVNKLINYSWPGNIRELENVIDRAMLALENSDVLITSSHVPDLEEKKQEVKGTLKEMTEELEKKIIIELLEACHGNKTEVARKLGLTVRNLYYKLDRYGIK